MFSIEYFFKYVPLKCSPNVPHRTRISPLWGNTQRIFLEYCVSAGKACCGVQMFKNMRLILFDVFFHLLFSLYLTLIFGIFYCVNYTSLLLHVIVSHLLNTCYNQQSSNSYYILEAVFNRRGRLQKYTR